MGVDRAVVSMVFSRDFWRMATLWTVALIFSYFQLLLATHFPSLCRRRTRSYPRCCVSADQAPVCVVTGATSGLGAAAARALAAEGYHVVLALCGHLLAARSAELLHKTMREIKRENEDASLSVLLVDLSSIRSVKEFECLLNKWLLDSGRHPSIQLLVNNAGILATSHRVSADGFDQMMQTNYLAAFVLTNLLLPLLKNSPVPSKIVNVTSFTHQFVSETNVNEGTKLLRCLSTSSDYPSAHIYELSKFCLLLFSYELHRQLSMTDPCHKVSVISADPGAVETNIMREVPPLLSQLAFTALRITRLLQSPETGVGSIIDAALAPPDASGEYFFGGKGRTIRSSKLSYNARLAERLWSTSMVLFEEAQSLLHGQTETKHILSS